jgi:hypothetical protein
MSSTEPNADAPGGPADVTSDATLSDDIEPETELDPTSTQDYQGERPQFEDPDPGPLEGPAEASPA